MDWKMTNRAGTTNIWHIIPINIPPMAVAPSERLPLAPTPRANIIGSRPIIMASEVIRIGRRRAAAPRTAAHVMLMPILRRSSANSTIRMAFLARSPINMIIAICTYILLDAAPRIGSTRLASPISWMKIKQPQSPNGMDSITAKGRT